VRGTPPEVRGPDLGVADDPVANAAEAAAESEGGDAAVADAPAEA